MGKECDHCPLISYCEQVDDPEIRDAICRSWELEDTLDPVQIALEQHDLIIQEWEDWSMEVGYGR